MDNLKRKIKDKFWNTSLITDSWKENIFRLYLKLKFGNERKCDSNSFKTFLDELYLNESLNNAFSINYPKIDDCLDLKPDDSKLIAFYLPQFYPDEHNNKWWGKGVTEWTNVGKAMPHYVGHYQPRCPGELGYYDLRIPDNIYRQIELARIFGVYGFCFYYYWFDGERILDKPFDDFVNDVKIDFPFAICWANENWTQQWNGISDSTLLLQSDTVESYFNFIKSCYMLFSKTNYIKINGKPLLMIYRPDKMPKRKEVINEWRKFVYEKLGLELYISAVYREGINFEDDGFDSVNEFAPNLAFNSKKIKDITSSKKIMSKNFFGHIYDYESFVKDKLYFEFKNKNTYRALCPMWDNTPRRKSGANIFDGATPDLYKMWLKDIIVETRQRVEEKKLDDNIIFINAWNEWAEGAYLEPDLYWKYGYLEATRDAILETRRIK